MNRSPSVDHMVSKPFQDIKAHPVLSERELSDIILLLALEIQEQYPELSKFMAEIPDDQPIDNIPESHLEQLADYYENLKSLKEEYTGLE